MTSNLETAASEMPAILKVQNRKPAAKASTKPATKKATAKKAKPAAKAKAQAKRAEPKVETVKTGSVKDGDKRIVILRATNHRDGTLNAGKWAKLRDKMTVADYMATGVDRGYVRWLLEHKFVKLS